MKIPYPLIMKVDKTSRPKLTKFSKIEQLCHNAAAYKNAATLKLIIMSSLTL